MRAWVLVGTLLCCIGCAKESAPPPSSGHPTETSPAPPYAPPSSAEGDRSLRFAVIPKQKDNPVFSYARGAAEAAAAELGVEVLWDAPEQSDEAAQARILEAFISQEVDGIAVSCINAELMKRAIDKAVEAGIPVVTWDSDSPTSRRTAFYGIDDYGTGRLLAEELLALLPEGGTVALLSGVQGAANLEERLRGAREVLAEAEGIELVATEYCDDDVPRAEQVVTDVMARYPDLGGWIMVGGWPLFAKNGLSAVTPGKTKVVSVDPLPEAQHWIADGYVQVCVGQKVFGWGRESVRMLYALARGESIEGLGEGGFVDSGVDLVVNDKSGRYADERYTLLSDYAARFAAGPG